MPGPDETVPAIKAQTVREAVDDHRYVATLEQAIAAAKADAGKGEAVAKAERFLDDLRGRIPVDFRTLVGFQVDPRAAGRPLVASSRTPTRWTACAGRWRNRSSIWE